MSDYTVASFKINGWPTTLLKKSDVGWMLLASYIVAWDIHAIKSGQETLSRGFWRGLQNPRSRWPVILVATSIWKHLVLPKFCPWADPLWWFVEKGLPITQRNR